MPLGYVWDLLTEGPCNEEQKDDKAEMEMDYNQYQMEYYSHDYEDYQDYYDNIYQSNEDMMDMHEMHNMNQHHQRDHYYDEEYHRSDHTQYREANIDNAY